MIETAIRNAASNYNTNFETFTGGFNILQLNDVNSVRQYMFLDNLQLPIPKFTWKVVQNLENSAAIAFVTVNNPFLDSISPEYLLCPDICTAYGWNNTAFSNLAKGYTYCCDVNTLRSIVLTIPYVNYTNVLQNKN